MQFYISNYYYIVAYISFLFLAIVIAQFLKHRKIKVFGFRFSNTNYYILHSIFVIPLFLEYIFLKNNSVFYFIVLGVAGILGEILFSYIWDTFFPKKFWKYSVETVLEGYSSFLNIIPWGVGGILFLQIYKGFDLQYDNPIVSISLFNEIHHLVVFSTVSAIVLFIIFLFQKSRGLKDLEFKGVNVVNYFIFVSFITIPILFISIFYAKDYLLISLAFGIIAFLLEYLYGKFCELFISKKLWTYTYATFDSAHGSVLAIIPFIIAGWYFVIVNELLNLIKLF